MPEATPAIEIDFVEARKDPYPLLHRLRDEDPVHWLDSMGIWLVTRYDDVKMLFSDSRVSADQRTWQHYTPPAENSYMRWIDDHGLMAVSPKEHTRQRKLLASGFTPRGVARMQDQIKEVVERYGEPLKERSGIVDIMAEFTTPIPNAVISQITGVAAPGEAEHRFSRLAQETIQGFFGFVSDEIKARAEQSYGELAGWVRDTILARRLEPRADLISDLVEAREGSDRLSDDNIVAQVTALIAAGSETTATGGMLSITTLLDHPEALERVRADRKLIPQAVSEILRYGFGGISGMRRFASEDFELHGKSIRKGQMLLLSLGGASHDPRVYPNPDRFDLDRNPQNLMTFGSGPHFCLGANLARGELECMIDSALDFLPPGATFLRSQAELQTIGLFDRPMTCPVDFGSGR